MKKYSAKKKRRTCKKGGTTPKIEVSFMDNINQLNRGKKYALIYDYQGKTITKFFTSNESAGYINDTYKFTKNILNCKNAKLIEYEYI